MNQEFLTALDALQSEKNIDKEELIEAIETSIKAAYDKHYGEPQDGFETSVRLDRETGEINVYAAMEVVDDVLDKKCEVTLEEAREIDPSAVLGSVVYKQITPKDFGRIAAQNAKQLIMQRIKEAERNLIYDEYSKREGELINATVSRVGAGGHGHVNVNLGLCEALLPYKEQVPGEVLRPNERIKVYLTSVKKTSKGPMLTVSRTHPDLVKRLFEQEVPEIYDDVVEIISISREAGSRTKIAVASTDPSVDPVGACVGQRGVRVQNIISEINDEKIDVIRYSDDTETYLTNALSPAKVLKIIPNKAERTALAVVDDYQLSLAIGKEGQNVRLAAKLTGWKIDIKSKSDYDKLVAENPNFDAEFMEGGDEPEVDIADLDDIPDVEIDEFDALFEEADDEDDVDDDDLIETDLFEDSEDEAEDDTEEVEVADIDADDGQEDAAEEETIETEDEE